MWNGLALLSAVSAFVTWIVQFYLKLTHNVLLYENREKGKWSSEGGAGFGYSFALVVIAALVYLVDILIIYIANRDPQKTKQVKKGTYFIIGF